MRIVSLSLAALAAFVPSVAIAQYTPEQQAEMACVYSQLTPEQRAQVVDMLFATDEAAGNAAEQALNPVFDAADEVCIARYDWGEDGVIAGEEYAIATITFEATQFALPGTVPHQMLDRLMAGFPPEFSYTFTYEGQELLDEEGVEAWRARAEQSLREAGVAESDRGFAIVYLGALADFSLAGAKWTDLFERQVR